MHNRNNVNESKEECNCPESDTSLNRFNCTFDAHERSETCYNITFIALSNGKPDIHSSSTKEACTGMSLVYH